MLIKRGRDIRDVRTHRGKAVGGHSKKVAICKPKREVSGETKPAGTLTLISKTVRKLVSVKLPSSSSRIGNCSPSQLIQRVNREDPLEELGFLRR